MRGLSHKVLKIYINLFHVIKSCSKFNTLLELEFFVWQRERRNRALGAIKPW